MPTISDSVPGQHETIVVGIYIARGDETLGPYTSLEAAALVARGQLRPDDYAACSGDTAWVALADFLPLPTFSSAVESSPITALSACVPQTHPHHWRRLAAAFIVLLAAPVIVTLGARWLGHHRAGERAEVFEPLRTGQASGVTAPLPLVAILPPVEEVTPPEASGPLNGSLFGTLPGGERLPLAGVRVSAFPLAALEPALAQENDAAQAARAKLDPQIQAAAAERIARAAEAHAALQALHEAKPADPLYASLRFASQGAKTAASTADDDYRYLVEERAAAAGGAIYFRGLPEPAFTTNTDALGNFTLTIPSGDEPYVVAARTKETTSDGTILLRFWLVRLSPAQQAGREPLRLDSDNTSSSPAAESLIHTAE